MARLKGRSLAEKVSLNSIPDPSTGCRVWVGGRTDCGYGCLQVDKQKWYAHRASYVSFIGPIPEGLVLDHLCRNRACVNPAHLEAVTRRINNLRGVGAPAVHAVKTHCIRGHPFNDEHTYKRPDGKGKHCRTCIRERYACKNV